MEPTDPRDSRVVIAVWELRDPRESRDSGSQWTQGWQLAVCVEAKGVKDGSSCVGAKGTEGPMRTK